MPVPRRYPLLALALCGLLVAPFARLLAGDIPSVEPASAAQRAADGSAVIIDVREAAEWQETGVVASAHLLPLSDLRANRDRWREFLEQHRDKELILYCRSGNRSGQAAEILAKEGFRVANAGGFRDWVAAGQPTRKAEQPRPKD